MYLHGNRTIGDLLAGGFKMYCAFFINWSSVFRRVSIFIPNAHLAITSMVKELNTLKSRKEIVFRHEIC